MNMRLPLIVQGKVKPFTLTEVPGLLASRQMNRVPVLDGVRGIAILLVLWYHFTPEIGVPVRAIEWLKKTSTGGWLGVELFFVLSGFLITGILLDAKGSPNFFRNFYARRILRIFPLYYACLAFVLLLLPRFE